MLEYILINSTRQADTINLSDKILFSVDGLVVRNFTHQFSMKEIGRRGKAEHFREFSRLILVGTMQYI